MTAAAPTSIVDALAHWHGRDQGPLRLALKPPCDVLDDECYDVALAVVFRDVAAQTSLIARIGRIQVAIDVHQPQLAHLKSIDREHQVEAAANAARIEAMLRVLEQWKAALLAAVDVAA